MSDDDHEAFQKATNCCICHKAFADTDKKVKHHQHFPFEENCDQQLSNFLGATHNKCNLLARECTFIPVVFHNLKNFDSHLIMQGLESFRKSKITCIPQKMEKYVIVSIESLRFIDSFQFLPSSLENVVESLVQSDHNLFISLGEHFLAASYLKRF